MLKEMTELVDVVERGLGAGSATLPEADSRKAAALVTAEAVAEVSAEKAATALAEAVLKQ